MATNKMAWLVKQLEIKPSTPQFYKNHRAESVSHKIDCVTDIHAVDSLPLIGWFTNTGRK